MLIKSDEILILLIFYKTLGIFETNLSRRLSNNIYISSDLWNYDSVHIFEISALKSVQTLNDKNV